MVNIRIYLKKTKKQSNNILIKLINLLSHKLIQY
jgi:hypothetical protein